MKLTSFIIWMLIFACGIVLGFSVSWYLQAEGAKNSATAGILAAGESIRSNDLVSAMFYAQSVVHSAPDAYDGYQLVGDVYVQQGYKVGAQFMYEQSLEKLKAGGTKSMLVEAGVSSVPTAEELLRRKLQSL